MPADACKWSQQQEVDMVTEGWVNVCLFRLIKCFYWVWQYKCSCFVSQVGWFFLNVSPPWSLLCCNRDYLSCISWIFCNVKLWYSTLYIGEFPLKSGDILGAHQFGQHSIISLNKMYPCNRVGYPALMASYALHLGACGSLSTIYQSAS